MTTVATCDAWKQFLERSIAMVFLAFYPKPARVDVEVMQTPIRIPPESDMLAKLYG